LRFSGTTFPLNHANFERCKVSDRETGAKSLLTAGLIMFAAHLTVWAYRNLKCCHRHCWGR
jgi:hypothetical protein